jgi:hypothetical protein
MMKLLKVLLISVIVIAAMACEAEEKNNTDDTAPAVEFFNNMSELCGETFTGGIDYPDDPEHEMAGFEYTMIVESCTEKEIRIPFHVGENKSRTWVLTLEGDRLLFKHDHRHEDGTPEDLTMYGGYANENGDAYRQYFPADQQTTDMLPEAASNVWMMHIDEENSQFVYYLERHNAPRFRAVFTM